MSDGSGRICRPFSELSSGLYVIVLEGLDGWCEKKWLLMWAAGKVGLKRSVGKGQENAITKCHVIFVSSWDSSFLGINWTVCWVRE